ncbi:O-antigen ligase family protein [Desulfobacula sp.]|uniref:O-antigen ligase family protein n=1 Tax=Desulfobacula sp. TaxID=2593537 RepID=UPI001D5C556A|nr:O-antigen ligase family protein [Desulfobacula sp.]
MTIKANDLIFYFIVLTFFALPTGTAPPLISIGLAALIWLVSGKIAHIKKIIMQPWFYPVIPFLVLPWIGLLYSQNTDLGMDYALKTKYWLVIFITAGFAFDEEKVFILLKWFWAGLLMGAFLALIQVMGIVTPIQQEYLGFGIVHTLLCMYLITGILTASFYFKNTGSWNGRFVFLFLILAFLFHLAVLRGRTGYLIFGIISPFVANNLMYKFSRKIKIAVAVILVCFLLLSPIVKEEVKGTFVKLNEQKENILKGEYVVELSRFFMVRESVRIIMAHPFMGIGTGSITEPTKARGHLVTHPHNNFLYMGASYGILGIAACFWLFWKMFKTSWRLRNTALGYFVFSACIVLFLGGMFDTQILNTGTLLFLSLTYGLLNHLRNPVV